MQKQRWILIAGSIYLALMSLCYGCSPTTTPTIVPTNKSAMLSIPYADAPTIDGTLASEEWEVAHVEHFADGSELLLMREADYLYLGIRATTNEMIAANIYTEENGEIIIHHASAALGTAIYQSSENTWLKSQDFQWQCRATDNSAASQVERENFLQGEHWLAANSRMGTPNELEYQIKITREALPLAVVFMRSSKPDIRIYFPDELADDTIQPTPDGLPETRNFIPKTWLLLDLAQHE